MDWDKLKIFHNVALDLNISEAANKMNISCLLYTSDAADDQ